MFGSIRRYRLNSGGMDDLLHRVDMEFAEKIKEEDGFVSYQVFDCGDDQLCSITVFRDRDGAERSNELAAEWVQDTLAGDFDLTRLDTMLGEVAVSRAESEVLEPAHH